jgi:hypothetical protein
VRLLLSGHLGLDPRPRSFLLVRHREQVIVARDDDRDALRDERGQFGHELGRRRLVHVLIERQQLVVERHFWSG